MLRELISASYVRISGSVLHEKYIFDVVLSLPVPLFEVTLTPERQMVLR